MPAVPHAKTKIKKSKEKLEAVANTSKADSDTTREKSNNDDEQMNTNVVIVGMRVGERRWKTWVGSKGGEERR